MLSLATPVVEYPVAVTEEPIDIPQFHGIARSPLSHGLYSQLKYTIYQLFTAHGKSNGTQQSDLDKLAPQVVIHKKNGDDE